MKIARATYKGNFRTEATHLATGSTIITDAPKDNNGQGSTFSPTDLFSTSLLTCAMTVAAIAAKKHGIAIGHMEGEVEKVMQASPRKVARVAVTLRIEGQFSPEQQALLHDAAIHCPVALSLGSETEKVIEVVFA